MPDDSSGGGDIERTLDLLWHPERSSDRGPQRSLSLGAIVDAAIELADAEGLDAVSFRAVAARLGVGTMTLYRYVPGKSELLDLMLDRVNGPSDEPLPDEWRAAMEAMARRLWHLYGEHRWLPFVDQSRPVLGPNAVKALEQVVAALDGCGLNDREAMSLVTTIESFVSALARTANAIAMAQERTGVSHEDFWTSQESVLVAAMESGEFPHVAGLADDVFDASNDEVLEFGLRSILDGVEALISSRAADDG